MAVRRHFRHTIMLSCLSSVCGCYPVSGVALYIHNFMWKLRVLVEL